MIVSVTYIDDGEVTFIAIDDATIQKHQAGKHDQKTHGRRGSSYRSSSAWVPPEERVWQGEQVAGKRQLTPAQTGAIGEELATKALEDVMGVPFSQLNVGINNAPIDIAGDHHAVEVKAGLATNGYTAQHWRATHHHPNKAEKALIDQMTKQEKRAHFVYKGQQALERKQAMLDKMSDMAGEPIKPAMVGIILSPDGKRGDVYLVPGFHLRVPWKQGATEDNYIGTYEVG